MRITKRSKTPMSPPLKHAALPRDLRLSVQNADGETLTVPADYALLVTLPADRSKRFITITPSHVDGTPIADVDVSWSSDAEIAAEENKTTKGATPNRIGLFRPGTATVRATIRKDTPNQQSASLTIVIAPDVLVFGPDGRYYRVNADAWQAHPVPEDKVPEPVQEMIQHGSVLFTSAHLVKGTLGLACYVINLASMS
ncbi:MAG TPA: hypothetical protein VNM90_28205, partial [Haliangium sp.]|nr:hypothetical protein [Haliangium sp.]